MIRESEQFVVDDFRQAIGRICDNVIKSVRAQGAVDHQIAGESDSVYIKSVDGKLLITNNAYDQVFAGGHSPVGRIGNSYLNQTIIPIATQSDSMILEGCQSVEFDHVGHDTDGRKLRMLTHKRSLLGLGHPTMAILGITRSVEVLSSERKPTRNLRLQWSSFNGLDELDRNIAIGLARGKNVSSIAAENGVTKKTIENHRATILRTLGFETPIDVVKLIVRLQENGFGDFGA